MRKVFSFNLEKTEKKKVKTITMEYILKQLYRICVVVEEKKRA